MGERLRRNDRKHMLEEIKIDKKKNRDNKEHHATQMSTDFPLASLGFTSSLPPPPPREEIHRRAAMLAKRAGRGGTARPTGRLLPRPRPVRRSARLCLSALGACLDLSLARCSLPVLRPLSAALPVCTVCLRVSPSAFLSPPTQRGAPRTAGSAALRLRARCAQRRCSGCRCPGCRTGLAGPGAISLPARTSPGPARPGDAPPGRCLSVVWGGSVCLSRCLPACPPVWLWRGVWLWLPARRHLQSYCFPPPLRPPRQPALSQEQRQSTGAGLITGKLVNPLRFLVICSHPLPVGPATRPPRKIKREGNGPSLRTSLSERSREGSFNY
ncbi:PREDICTED: uncharacterized protein LOC107604352 [Ficedula albicollis]|uniref:uncharacterized protein LOC107604352 n=1 Tax=Ficedula albicollis TaxID=59894 RepID=UPI0007AD8EB8|nr:PREDICTED: uncharacterized protein LOC107604352 [Ficedula albicollis]